MRITGFNPIRSSSTKRVSSSSSSATGAFDEVLASASEQMQQAAQISGSAPVSGLDMLALQEISDEEARRKTLMRDGEQSLEALDKLRSALLMGVLPQSTLRNLEKVVARQRAMAPPDPKLASILDEIELRAAVELAKLEMAKNG